MRALNVLVMACVSLTVGCGSCGDKKKKRGNSDPKVVQPYVVPEDAPDGLWMKVSEGSKQKPPREKTKAPKTKKIGEAEARSILARMSELETKKEDTKSFAFRESSLPPPRTGDTVKDAFPPNASAAPPASLGADKLEVLRFAPEGDVPLAPNLSVTFNQPMVAVTSHADSIKNLPVTLSPQPKGNWRWIGTKTLLFDPEVRFPQATKYLVQIKEGAKSTAGATLAAGKRFTFSTPAPKLKTTYPPEFGVQGLSPLIVVAFDQRIDAALVLAKLQVKASGRVFDLRRASPEEIAKDEEVSRVIERLEKSEQSGRYLVVRTSVELPLDSQIDVVVREGTPSAEGPLTTEDEQRFTFQTYGAFEVTASGCGYRADSECRPEEAWRIVMTNPIDKETFDSKAISVTPKIAGLRAAVQGNSIQMQGDSQPNTKYTITLPSTLKDKFGQGAKKGKGTVDVIEARPKLWGPEGLVIVDPSAKKPTLDLFSTGYEKLRVQIYKVTPAHWRAYEKYQDDRWDTDKKARPPGKRVYNKDIKIAPSDSSYVETSIDLEPALKNNLGHALVVVETLPKPKSRYDNRNIHVAWLQVTNIGLDVQTDADEMVAFATKLSDGSPLEGVSIAMARGKPKLTTDAMGMATLRGENHSEDAILIGKQGKDTAFMPANDALTHHNGSRSYRGRTTWQPRPIRKIDRWFVYNDRGMYRPGETVHIKGWLRDIGAGTEGDLQLSEAKELTYSVKGSRGNPITSGTATINALGGFDTKFELPATPNLGSARVSFSALGAYHTHEFKIEEFRRPEFEVTAEASPAPHMIGDTSSVTAHAKYLAGGGLGGADLRWSVQASTGSFTPPNREAFSFGTWVPWWRSKPDSEAMKDGEHLSSKTDASGAHIIDIDFLSIKPPRPMNVLAQASVTDVNRQAWSSSTTLLVHPADIYVGLKRERYFVNPGTPMKVEAVVVDHDGEAVAGSAVVVKAVLMRWTWDSSEWKAVEQESEECKLVSTSEAQECSFSSKVGGRYQITASVVDSRGRPNQSQTTMWVSGGKKPASRKVEEEAITLIPDKKEYRPGDTAKILVQSPFLPAEGIISIRRSGLVSTERISLTKGGTTIDVGIVDAHTPNVIVQVDLVGTTSRLDDKGEETDSLPKRAAFATGKIDLSVPPHHQSLQVEVTPAKDQLEPGGETTLKVAVRDANNKPISGAEISVVVVDESVLSLSNYKTPEPLMTFYPKRRQDVMDHRNRKYLTLARADKSALASAASPDDTGWGTIGIGGYGIIGHGSGTGSGYGSGTKMAEAEGKMGKKESTRATGQFAMKRNNADPQLAKQAAMSAARSAGVLGIMGAAEPSPSIEVRSDFNALATFAPEVRTDASGHATVAVKLPDNLTRYRVMVAAVAGVKQFGHGESSITARKAMMVRPSPPRFLNFGDQMKLPVVIQNQTDKEMTVKVAVRAENAELTGGSGQEVVVPANDRVELLFPAKAKMPGTARFQVGASAGPLGDANEFSFPVWTPATSEAFATYGEVDEGAVRQSVAMPSGVVKEFGELQVTTSSTQLQALTDAILYLVAYKFECAEQLSSRILAVAGLRDVLSAFEAEGLPAPKEIEAAVRRDLRKLKGRQKYYGAFGFWTKRDRDWPYISIHVAHALARAQKKGFTIPGDMINKSKSYLRDVETRLPHCYSLTTRRTLLSYALFVRTLMGDRDAERARRLIRDVGVEKLPMHALGWLLYTMSSDKNSQKERAAIHEFLNSKISETASTATFTTRASDGDHLILHSSRRTDGILLEALIEDKPDSDLIAKITRGLLAHRKRGHWGNTQDNAFVLLALDRYFRTYEKETPDFVTRMWLGEAYAGDHKFAGRTTERHQVNVPMSYLAEGPKERELVIQKEGKGRMYFRIGMTYAPENLKIEAADHGFAVDRQYEAVDEPDDVVQLADGSWKIKAGAMVRVRLTMVATSRRYHVALVDPLPGGLEPMNPALAVTGAIPQDPKAASDTGRYWWWSRPWFEHQNLRDERVEAFTSQLWAGVHEYTYVGRATTPGSYTVPPTKAEEMYTPETFGRSATDKVVIE